MRLSLEEIQALETTYDPENSGLFVELQQAHGDKVKALLENGASWNQIGNTIVHGKISMHDLDTILENFLIALVSGKTDLEIESSYRSNPDALNTAGWFTQPQQAQESAGLESQLAYEQDTQVSDVSTEPTSPASDVPTLILSSGVNTLGSCTSFPDLP